MIRLPLPMGSLSAATVACGLAISPAIRAPDPAHLRLIAVLMLVVALMTLRAPSTTARLAPFTALPARLFHSLHACLLLVALLVVAVLIGQARLGAIDAGSLHAQAGSMLEFRGYLESPPRRQGQFTRLHLQGPTGRIAALVEKPPDDLEVGSGLFIHGRSSPAPEWLRSFLARKGIATVIVPDRIETVSPRGGLQGLLDRIRRRAVEGMTAGMDPREAALAAGFVLGRDEQIDAATKEHFRRSGLAHLLAASGQNVMLLILLGSLPLALAGVSLRRRVLPLCLLLFIYLGLTGADPSIQRATVMGVVMLAMLRLGRPQQRLFALLLAVVVTLIANPRASGDVGWQLSFAATGGIMILAPGLQQVLNAGGRFRAAAELRRGLADAAAVTLAATVATAPLIAHHFGALPLGTVSANLLALPAVAPVMWLGMTAGVIGQLPALPTEAINLINAVLIAYIAEVAKNIGSLESGVLEVSFGPGRLVVLVEIVLLLSAWFAVSRLRRLPDGRGLPRHLLTVGVCAAVMAPLAATLIPASPVNGHFSAPPGIRIVALDVGQGDAILIQRRHQNLLIDAGPPEPGLSRRLSRYGVKRLDAVFITHPDLDHIGGLYQLMREREVSRLLSAVDLPEIEPSAVDLVSAGDRITLGDLHFEVLWPPTRPHTDTAETNESSLVMLLRWHDFTALFTGDAEAEATGYEAEKVDLLKIAHHGSADAGLQRLLERSSPRLAVISVGAENRYGHPSPSTLETLRKFGVSTYRTDELGDVIFELAE